MKKPVTVHSGGGLLFGLGDKTVTATVIDAPLPDTVEFRCPSKRENGRLCKHRLGIVYVQSYTIECKHNSKGVGFAFSVKEPHKIKCLWCGAEHVNPIRI